MFVYCDASALVKLVVDEPESDALEAWLDRSDQPFLFSSIVAFTEVPRAVRRHGEAAVEEAHELLEEISIIDLDRDLAKTAADVQPESVRSLDAIHLAAALKVSETLTAVVAYDKRVIEAARAAGLTVQHPGM